MNFTAADPLAEAYNIMKKNKQIDNGVEIDTAFVELLGKNMVRIYLIWYI